MEEQTRVRLQKFLAEAGVASRRQAEKMILDGKVTVNGVVVTQMGVTVQPGQDTVAVNGKLVHREEKVYLLLNKPTGYVTTVRDPQGRPTVMDLIKNLPVRVYPVGRLDYATEGFLLMTNDGELAWALTHPRHHVPKYYLAQVQGVPGPEELRRFRSGLMLDDGPTAPAEVRLVSKDGGDSLLAVTLYEGRNRQVRRMCEAINHPVVHLKRTGEGSLRLGNLAVGAFRFLTREEVGQLRKALGLDVHPSQDIK